MFSNTFSRGNSSNLLFNLILLCSINCCIHWSCFENRTNSSRLKYHKYYFQERQNQAKLIFLFNILITVLISNSFRFSSFQLILSVVIFLFLIPAAIFTSIESDWNYLDSLYYCFISLTTVGLGDFIPGDNPDQTLRPLYKACTTCKTFLFSNRVGAAYCNHSYCCHSVYITTFFLFSTTVSKPASQKSILVNIIFC